MSLPKDYDQEIEKMYHPENFEYEDYEARGKNLDIFGTRVRNSLRRAGFSTPQELIDLKNGIKFRARKRDWGKEGRVYDYFYIENLQDLRKIKNIGETTVRLINEVLLELS